jgi:hypothetical protein
MHLRQKRKAATMDSRDAAHGSAQRATGSFATCFESSLDCKSAISLFSDSRTERFGEPASRGVSIMAKSMALTPFAFEISDENFMRKILLCG